MSATKITSKTPVPDIVDFLTQSGCPNVTAQIDTSQCSQWSINGGGQGDIYEGMLVNGDRVAIKTARGDQSLDPSKGDKEFKRVARELNTWFALNHPNIAKLLGMAMFRDRIAMISPWIEPGNFYKFISKFPGADRLGLCAQVATGLEYLHENGVIFGDLKAENVLVGLDGVAKITDFGLSLLRQSRLPFSTTQNPGGGSIRWMAPELIQGLTERTYEADMYALAMTFIEFLTGKAPFPASTDANVMYMAVFTNTMPDRPERLEMGSTYHDNWWFFMQQCWSREPHTRPMPDFVYSLHSGTELEITELAIATPVGVRSFIHVPRQPVASVLDTESVLLDDSDDSSDSSDSSTPHMNGRRQGLRYRYIGRGIRMILGRLRQRRFRERQSSNPRSALAQPRDLGNEVQTYLSRPPNAASQIRILILSGHNVGAGLTIDDGVALRWGQLRRALQNAPEGVVTVVILACCIAGDVLEDLVDIPNTVLMAACANEVAVADNYDGDYFLRALLEVLDIEEGFDEWKDFEELLSRTLNQHTETQSFRLMTMTEQEPSDIFRALMEPSYTSTGGTSAVGEVQG